MKKPLAIILVILLCNSLAATGYLYWNSTRQLRAADELRQSLEEEISVVKTENVMLAEELFSMDKAGTHTYVQIFRYLHDCDYDGDTTGSGRAIIADQFQAGYPVLIVLDSAHYDYDFVPGQNYEITFTREIMKNGYPSDPHVIDVQPTDKLGLEQVMESDYPFN